MTPKDPRHMVQLLLILFTIYVGQNSANPEPNVARTCAQRENLMKILGVNPDKDYMVLVRWNHPALQRGLVLVDLPGLGSSAGDKIAEDGTTKRSHTRITTEYLQSVDSIFLLFPPEAAGGNASEILSTFLAGEGMKYIVSKENRIIPILNRVDGHEKQIPFSINSIRETLGELKPPCIYPTSAIAGEYRFVINGLCPVERTQKYAKTAETIREDEEDELTDAQVAARVLKRLKRAYEHPYPFTDLNNNTYKINLDQWIHMMTDNYLSRAQALKTVELTRMGMEANESVLLGINTRKAVWELLKDGGVTMTKTMIDTLTRYVRGCVDTFNTQFQKVEDDLARNIAEVSKTYIPKLVKSYTDALDTVEDDIRSTIRGEISKMQANAFGNYILNPNGTFFTEEGHRRAIHNKNVMDSLLGKLRNFSVKSRMKSSENQLKKTIDSIQRAYNDALPGLFRLYDELPVNLAQALEESYEQTRQQIAQEEGIAVMRKERLQDFDNVYGKLYRKLSDSILKEISQFVELAKKQIQQDKKITELQKRPLMKQHKLLWIYKRSTAHPAKNTCKVPLGRH